MIINNRPRIGRTSMMNTMAFQRWGVAASSFAQAYRPLEASVDDSLLLMEELWRRALAAGKLVVS
jgi:hypothetical protein